MKLALFDFDGTISRKDSMIDFIKYAVGKFVYYRGLFKISPKLLSYLMKQTTNTEAKQALLAHFFAGWRIEDFNETTKRYAEQNLQKIIRPSAVECIKWHQSLGHHVIVISASIEDWLRPWCNQLNLELIGSHLVVKNQFITGQLQGLNCHGKEKVRRLKNHLQLEDYQFIYAYGDSKGDKEMLLLADEVHYRSFK